MLKLLLFTFLILSIHSCNSEKFSYKKNNEKCEKCHIYDEQLKTLKVDKDNGAGGFYIGMSSENAMAILNDGDIYQPKAIKDPNLEAGVCKEFSGKVCEITALFKDKIFKSITLTFFNGHIYSIYLSPKKLDERLKVLRFLSKSFGNPDFTRVSAQEKPVPYSESGIDDLFMDCNTQRGEILSYEWRKDQSSFIFVSKPVRKKNMSLDCTRARYYQTIKYFNYGFQPYRNQSHVE